MQQLDQFAPLPESRQVEIPSLLTVAIPKREMVWESGIQVDAPDGSVATFPGRFRRLTSLEMLGAADEAEQLQASPTNVEVLVGDSMVPVKVTASMLRIIATLRRAMLKGYTDDSGVFWEQRPYSVKEFVHLMLNPRGGDQIMAVYEAVQPKTQSSGDGAEDDDRGNSLSSD